MNSLHSWSCTGWTSGADRLTNCCAEPFYRLRRTSGKSVNWERSCWRRSATWRRGRRRLWRLLPAAQPNTSRTCRTNSSVSDSVPREKHIDFTQTPFKTNTFSPGLQRRLTALPPTLRSMKTDYASLRSQVRNFSDFYGAAISDAKKQVCTTVCRRQRCPNKWTSEELFFSV